MSYNLTIGLETHIELSTKTKMFCGCSTKFGAKPNSQCCPVCLGLPGSLPVLNKKVVENAIKAGIATGCSINKLSKLDRKNYFYPDLAKAYQISQRYMPVCKDGHIKLDSGKAIKITDIHIEEDAGKIIYEDGNILIDYNRSGVPLIEIVTAPDFNSAQEAVEYENKLIKIMRHIGISDCRMEEGSVRIDINVSVSKEDGLLGTKVEIKNINSLKNLKRAIDFEKDRQVSILESLGKVQMETRRFDEETGKTQTMRQKEHASDYRYFADPDLPPIRISKEWVCEIKDKMPISLDEKIKIYKEKYNIPIKDAETILKYNKAACFFEEASKNVKNKTIVLNFILGEVFNVLGSEKAKQDFNIKISPIDLGKLALLVEDGKISFNLARFRLRDLIKTGNLDLSFNVITEGELISIIEKILEENVSIVKEYLKGKTSAIEPLIGKAIQRTLYEADPIKVREIIADLIDNINTKGKNIDKNRE